MQTRDFVHVSDVVNALVTVGSEDRVNGQVYNLGIGKTTSIIELAKLILTILNLQDRTVVTTTGTSWQGDVTKIWFDNSKARKELNWTPKVTLEDSIKEVRRFIGFNCIRNHQNHDCPPNNPAHILLHGLHHFRWLCHKRLLRPGK